METQSRINLQAGEESAVEEKGRPRWTKERCGRSGRAEKEGKEIFFGRVHSVHFVHFLQRHSSLLFECLKKTIFSLKIAF